MGYWIHLAGQSPGSSYHGNTFYFRMEIPAPLAYGEDFTRRKVTVRQPFATVDFTPEAVPFLYSASKLWGFVASGEATAKFLPPVREANVHRERP